MKDIPIVQQPTAFAADVAGPSSSGGVTARAHGLSRFKERVIEALLFLAALSSVAITLGIVGILIYESSTFFAHVSFRDFISDPLWTPLFNPPHFGIMP